ncbi:CMRF35-like molecule 1 [Megalobrama amblycephala]|uniref:CMRF35-like molecule 1 n=1 Tax=Megalobrama amblycephala TaxID=75352 RepID=UPI002013EE8F|nr:CMRF35-like molecule 1 [Megalobrama amblycephala]XP_048051309.1 CMRF35-like molecule 1 [Megalobrama amblycephala]
MKFPLTVCVFLLTVISSLSVDFPVRGMEGESVIIKCPYPRGYENSYKYFFKGVFRERVLIRRSDGGKSKGRFSLQDDRKTRSFTVTISKLKMEDAGIYACRAGADHYKEVNLIVLRAPQRPKPVQIFTSTFYPDQTISSFSNTPPYLRTSDTIPQSSSITITDHQISSSTELNFTSHHSSEQEVKGQTDGCHGNMSFNGLYVSGSVVIIITVEVLVLLLIAVSLVIVTVRNKKKKKGLLSSIEAFNPVFYEQIKDAGRHCDPEDRDTITTVFYSCVFHKLLL